MDEQLIELIRNSEELYNLGNKLYFDTALKNRRWTEIADELNKTADECKQRWESLRSQFRKICKTRETTGQASKKKKKWRYEDEMAFLLPYMKIKSRVSSVQLENQVKEEEGEIQAEDDVDGNDEQQDWTTDVSSDAVTTAPKQNIQRKKIVSRRMPSTESTSSTLMNYILSQKDLEPTNAVTKEKDSIDLFFDSIKATVRTFSPVDFHTAKTRIFNIVSEIERPYVLAANVNKQLTEN
ncbi:unnamed protein product [Psylliodes chrysocephalus]|uniref:MADF domain-containing protein n=1 Tax=Psylliodes chrysocephalus TaxID=3402493 RepID=A0A9P0DEY3_9CUCU|nr:unnamed protein product [Psylliodes chrysocephala]